MIPSSLASGEVVRPFHRYGGHSVVAVVAVVVDGPDVVGSHDPYVHHFGYFLSVGYLQ